MNEVKHEVRVFQVTLACKNCLVGEMVCNTEFVKLSYPPSYEHICTACKASTYLTTKYPYIEYKRIYWI